MSTIATIHCDSPECRNTIPSVSSGLGHNARGWISINQGGAAHHDFCSWACVAVFAKVRWEPRAEVPSRRRSDAKPVTTVDPSYLCDAVQPPLPGVQ